MYQLDSPRVNTKNTELLKMTNLKNKNVKDLNAYVEIMEKRIKHLEEVVENLLDKKISDLDIREKECERKI